MRDFHSPGRSPVYGTHGMAATSMPAATLAALDVLRAGGNALDAAVAAVAVLCVIEPQSTGIGGDCFCLYAPAGQRRVVALNGVRPGAGRRRRIDWFERARHRSARHASAHAVTVPGAVSAWETLLAAHGTKGLDELLQPAIRYAEEGWPVHPRVAYDWARRWTSCAATAPTRSCRAASRRGRAIASPSRSSPRPCARSRSTARGRSTRGRSPPTWWRPCAPAAGCTPRRISPPAARRRIRRADPCRLARLRGLAMPAQRLRACWC